MSQMSDVEQTVKSDYMEKLYKKIQKRKKLRDIAEDFMKSSEYSAARDVLKELLVLFDESDKQLDILLQIAECDIMLQGNIKADTNDDIIKNLENSGLSCYDVQDMAKQQDGSPAVILHLYASKLLVVEAQPDEAVKGIGECVRISQNEIDEIREKPEQKKRANKLVSLMCKMLEELRKVKGADEDLYVHAEATCLNKIGLVYSQLERRHHAYPFLSEGRKLMEKHFGPKAARYDIFSSLAHNIAATYHERGQFAESIPHHENSISEIQLAQDVSENYRTKWLRKYRKNLKQASAMAGGNLSAVDLSDLSSDDDDDSADTKIDVPQIEDLAKRLSEHSGQSDALKRIVEKMSGISKGDSKLKILLLIADMDIMKSGNIKPETDGNILETLQQSNKSWRSVRKMAEQEKESISIILCLYTCKLLPFQTKPGESVKEIEESIRLAQTKINAIISNGDQENEAKKLMPLFKLMLEQLRDINNGKAVDKARAEATCLYEIGTVYNRLAEPQQALDTLTEGRRVMDNQFGSKAANYSIYASMANDIGLAHKKLGQFFDAATFHAKAFNEIKNTEDKTEDYKSERSSNYKDAFEEALSQLARTDPKKANDLREKFVSLLSASSTGTSRARAGQSVSRQKPITEGEEKRKSEYGFKEENKNIKSELHTENKTKVKAAEAVKKPSQAEEDRRVKLQDPFYDIGNGIRVNHTRPLRKGRQVYWGKMKGVQTEDVAVKKTYYSEKHEEEAKIMADLEQHPNTVLCKASLVHEVVPGLKYIYITMELCGQDTLHEIVMNQPLSDEYRKAVSLQITHGLAHIHRHNIVHGDLKPENILLSLDRRNVKICDYGLSKKLLEDKSQMTWTPGRVAGTLRWMAPDEKKSRKSDVYCAGLVFYFILSGGVVVGKDEGIRTEKLTCSDPDITMHLLMKMLDKDRQKRPNADEILKHPFFWVDDRKLCFYCEISDCLSPIPNTHDVIKELDSQGEKTITSNWVDELKLNKQETNDIKKQMQQPVKVYDRALQKLADPRKYNSESIYSCLRFIRNRYHHFQDDGLQVQAIFGSKDGIWSFFSKRFPKLFCNVYKFAMEIIEIEAELTDAAKKNKDKLPSFKTLRSYFDDSAKNKHLRFLWTDEKKLDFLCAVSKREKLSKEYKDKCQCTVGENWLEKLVLTEEEHKVALTDVEKSGSRYKVHKFALYDIYNNAVEEKRQDEADYDEKSAHSLLRFIVNLRKYLGEDGKGAALIFNNSDAGIWKFFSKRFPNLFEEVHSSVSTSQAYPHIMEELCEPSFLDSPR